MKLIDAIGEFLSAPKSKCHSCGSYPGCDVGWLCAECHSKLQPYYASGRSRVDLCASCGSVVTDTVCPRCASRPADIIPACSAHPYAPPANKLLLKFKYNGLFKFAGWLADEMVSALDDARFRDITVVTHVPMHFTRYTNRYYNQSAVLARELARKLGKPEKTLLRRVKYTKRQTVLSGEQRRKNLQNAFKAIKKPINENVLLVDDVRTTGTTVLTCARELLKAGAKKVYICTFASTEYRKP